MQTSAYTDENFEVSQGNFRWMEQVYGTRLGGGGGGVCLQNYGSVETKQGRLLAFPNVFHHRVSPFELKDKTKPGHRRFIALWLVDPLTRVINTGNVPPQQQSWWMESAFGNLGSDNAENVPQALAELVLEKTPSHPGLEEAAKRGGAASGGADGNGSGYVWRFGAYVPGGGQGTSVEADGGSECLPESGAQRVAKCWI
ncbi:hypothetical protein FALCPG4_016899 [Fusarium falciforme]